uniref:Putative ovule protein n=1 Tax=Solanum chacoense TaxID=4108 RepID=A0A0V0GME1_SOLCH
MLSSLFQCLSTILVVEVLGCETYLTSHVNFLMQLSLLSTIGVFGMEKCYSNHLFGVKMSENSFLGIKVF